MNIIDNYADLPVGKYLDILAAGLFFGAIACGVIWNGEE